MRSILEFPSDESWTLFGVDFPTERGVQVHYAPVRYRHFAFGVVAYF